VLTCLFGVSTQIARGSTFRRSESRLVLDANARSPYCQPSDPVAPDPRSQCFATRNQTDAWISTWVLTMGAASVAAVSTATRQDSSFAAIATIP